MKTKKISLRTAPADEKLPTGVSKLFGSPDVWEGFEWPEYLDSDGEWYCMDFICQINCSELARLDEDGLFPSEGLLYFFYPLENTPFHLQDGDPVCYYYAEKSGKLSEFVLKFDDDSVFGSKEQRIEFHLTEETLYPKHHLLGEPSIYPCDGDAEGLEDMILLFELDCFKTEDREVHFWDDGTLQFYVDPRKLKIGDLSNVQVRLNTT